MPRDVMATKDGVWPRKCAVSCQTGFDPHESEWGNPAGVMSSDPSVSEVALGSKLRELNHLST